jgi:multiple sugar transport system ATP-binding protein
MTLGDRVVVMRAGVVQQVGDPQQLYDNPTNLFVAGFIGSPAMNFLPAAVDDGKLRSALGDVPLTDRLRRELPGPDGAGELILGIRPEHFEDLALVDEQHRDRGGVFSGQVDVVESMGSDKYVYFELAGGRASSAELEELAADTGAADLPGAGTQLVTRLSAESPVVEGRPAKVWFDLDKVQLFDPETGRNLSLAKGD